MGYEKLQNELIIISWQHDEIGLNDLREILAATISDCNTIMSRNKKKNIRRYSALHSKFG